MAEFKAGNFKEETTDSLDLEQICMEIFLTCDKNKNMEIEVSKLITFIAPFINSAEEHLVELKKILDPVDKDPKVNFDSFLLAMKTWTSKFCSITNFVSNDRSEVKRLSDELKQSTPTKDYVEKGAKLDFDCGLNVSNISSYSYAGSVQSAYDPVYLNEQINELQHQNKKLLDTLNEVKQQLSNSEEINNNMQTDYDRLKKSYQSDQKLLAEFQKMKLEMEREREESNILMKNHNSVLISLNYYKKENSQLRKNILENEAEIQKNQELITTLQHKENKYKNKIEKYKKELEIKNNENSALNIKINEYSAMCFEKDDYIKEKDNYIKEISMELENVRSDNVNLKKRLADIYNENTSFKHSKSDSETYPVTDTETVASFDGFHDENAKEQSLQEELIKATNSDCIGPHTYCTHQLKIIQYEEDIENLHLKIQMQCDEITKINEINSELESQMELLSSQNESEIDKCVELKKSNESVNLLNQKLKSDIASIKNENKRFARLEQKIKKLENEIFEEKSKSDKFLIQNNSLQREKEKISQDLKQLENEKENILAQINSINNDCHNLEKKLKEDLLEKEKIISEHKNLEINFKNLEQKYLDLEEKSKEKQLQYDNLLSEYQILQINLKQFDQKNNEMEKYIQDELSKEKAENLSLKTLLKSKTENIINLETEIKKLKHENNNLFIQFNNEKIETETLIENLKIELKNIKQKLNNDVEKQLLEKEAELKKLNTENKDLKNKNNELILQINDLSKNQELLEQMKHHLERDLAKQNLKLKSLTDAINDLTDKKSSLESENKKYVSEIEMCSFKIEKLNQNIAKLEQKIQALRKSSTDLSSSKSETEQFLKTVVDEKRNLVSHLSFVQEQIKECRHVLGQNTLNVTKLWKPDLDTIMPDFSIDELTDEGSLSGIMKISEGMLTQDVKDLRNQTRLTGIMLKALAKIKQDEILQDEDVELSDELINEILVTTSTFSTNETSFPVPKPLARSQSMSPDCIPHQDMSEEEGYASLSLPHLNLGLGFHLSNGSGGHSVFDELEEEADDVLEEKIDEEKIVEEKGREREEKRDGYSAKKVPIKQVRSMSEGTAFRTLVSENGDITLFPNLKDNILESLGLQNGEDSRDRELESLTEEEVEAKFQTLALIFAIDAKSITQRQVLQRRQKDQAERNFHAEVERLEHGVNRLAPLCTDVETRELLQGVLKRITILVKAVQKISISTQIFGGVQQESRISSSITLILLHLRHLHHQRDTLRHQLTSTKRMLQESRCADPSQAAQRRLGTANGRVVTRRRASLANIPRPLDSPTLAGPAGRKMRRISADACTEIGRQADWVVVGIDSGREAGRGGMQQQQGRLLRPSRIELSLDLKKIREVSVENTLNNNEESDTEFIPFVTPTALVPTQNLYLEHQLPKEPLPEPAETFSDYLLEVIRAIFQLLMYCWYRWFRHGTAREITLYLFLLSLALLSIFTLNAMIISKLVNQGTVVQRIPWSWLTWDELWNILFDIRITGPRPY